MAAPVTYAKLVKIYYFRYYINLIEKTTTWEDPRAKYKHVYGPSIPMQVI